VVAVLGVIGMAAPLLGLDHGEDVEIRIGVMMLGLGEERFGGHGDDDGRRRRRNLPRKALAAQ